MEAEPVTVVLPTAFATVLIDHARASLPAEACALLGGTADGEVRSVHPAANRHSSPYRYDVDAADLIRIFDRIEAAGETLVAVFHSHPSGPAVPSPTDLREAHAPMLHLLAGARDGSWRLRAWWISDGQASEVSLERG